MLTRLTERARRLAFSCCVVATFALATFAPRLARAAGEDAAVREAVQQIMTEDYPGSLGPAKKKLEAELARCARKTCSAR